jgi:hypothetical protein
MNNKLMNNIIRMSSIKIEEYPLFFKELEIDELVELYNFIIRSKSSETFTIAYLEQEINYKKSENRNKIINQVLKNE